jgi:hypothetical protein
MTPDTESGPASPTDVIAGIDPAICLTSAD